MKDVKVVLVNESNAKSIISDSYTFGMLLLIFWLNYKFLGDSVIIKILISILFVGVVYSRGSKKIKRMNKKEALEYLTKNNDNRPETITQKKRS